MLNAAAFRVGSSVLTLTATRTPPPPANLFRRRRRGYVALPSSSSCLFSRTTTTRSRRRRSRRHHLTLPLPPLGMSGGDTPPRSGDRFPRGGDGDAFVFAPREGGGRVPAGGFEARSAERARGVAFHLRGVPFVSHWKEKRLETRAERLFTFLARQVSQLV